MHRIQRTWFRFKEILLEKSNSYSDLEVCQFKTNKPWLGLQYHPDGRIKKPEELENEMIEPPRTSDGVLLDKIQGSLLGMTVGDALGAYVEFRPHDYLIDHPVTDLQGGGTWGLKKGQFTDDTSMALCLAISLVTRHDFVLYDQLVRYKWWYLHGYMSSTGECFDIGAATSDSIRVFIQRQKAFSKKYNIPLDRLDYLSRYSVINKFKVNCSRSGAAGNGALMRLAPVPLFFHKHLAEAINFSGFSGYITHGDIKAFDACRYYGALIFAAINNYTKDELLADDFYDKHQLWFSNPPLNDEIRRIAKGSYKRKCGYTEGIRGNGYIVHALEAALWAFWSDDNSFEQGVLAAINLGDDTDTTAAIYGQLAGAYYGYKNLPRKWTDQIYAKKFILNLGAWIAFEGELWKPSQESSRPNQSSPDVHRAASLDDLLLRDRPPSKFRSSPIPTAETVPMKRKQLTASAPPLQKPYLRVAQVFTPTIKRAAILEQNSSYVSKSHDSLFQFVNNSSTSDMESERPSNICTPISRRRN